ncbi:transposase, IS4 family [Shewanella denitrificans OS217]|uniref:Transposase, IS4 family n=2 Tax=Shewanella TaxID=22 RepID=Q12IX5_SHEDO|nr:IS4-like element ISSde1 family transposase [Shewanella denitrificans]ABE54758.1 transposase, IS4 family [Shewanella denitrificans OS217]ABE55344.1 transposase, IS4 family [Shewanella denitrificans OS217]ABE55534.1 transposase, IS4 family [Shewanella denitrificans OS217]ABE56238.1 transposase, IS4 family [Shewanella denitrificans OS217]ABE56601.1 transposase, IS4 family [Shewanella denitrificans OS217]
MRDIHILHDLIKKQCPQIHQKRLNSLMVATESLLDGNQLSLTQLGRNITGSVAAKHNIKRIDRLLGNYHLAQDKITIYQWHARYLCGANPMPIILVDWSDVREQLRIMTLRASISVQGRSVTLYERTFLFEDYNAPRSHNAFLAELANVLPQGCCPLIVTDAGYRNTWFREVERYGWFWLGRVRGDVSFMHHGQTTWHSNKSLYSKANSTAKYIGNVQLARKSPLSCHLHLFKAKSKLRKDKRSSKTGRNHTAQKSYRLGSKEPWLLATNLPPEYFNPAKVVELYAKRMQIEETFRDLKSPQYGMGLRQSRSRCPKRYDVLLLIAMLAEILLWCIGIAARHLGWQKDFQANSIKYRAVLSVVRLGKEVRRRPKYTLKASIIYWALNEYIKLVHTAGRPKL